MLSSIDRDKDEDSDISAAEKCGILDQLGFSCGPLDSSFEDAALLCPTGQSHNHSHGASPQESGLIPVLQAVVSDSSPSVGTLSLTHLQPTKSNCQFVLLLPLPTVSSSTVSTQVDAFCRRPDEPDLHPRIALRSTRSVAFIQLGE